MICQIECNGDEVCGLLHGRRGEHDGPVIAVAAAAGGLQVIGLGGRDVAHARASPHHVDGGRHTPFFNGYRPQFYFRTTDVTGVATLPEGVEMVMPGDNVSMTVELITPVAREKELRFAIREGGRTVGAGVVADILE